MVKHDPVKLQNAAKLIEDRFLVLYVFENLLGDDEVEGCIFKRQLAILFDGENAPLLEQGVAFKVIIDIVIHSEHIDPIEIDETHDIAAAAAIIQNSKRRFFSTLY
jgi:hypothetical protein